MADIYASHFEYDGIMSRKYNLVIANVETGRFRKLSGDIHSNTIYNRNSKRLHLIGTDYSDSHLTFDVDIITDHELGIEFNMRREIEKWLFNRNKFCRLYFDIADDPFGEMFESVHGEEKRTYFNCRFINAEKLEYNGGIVGYKATIETDSPFLWQDTTSKTFAPTSDDRDRFIELRTDFDIDGFIYPTVRFSTGYEGGDITIINNTDSTSRQTKFVNLPANATVVMRGDINMISDGFYDNLSERNFVRVMDGLNEISVIGDVTSITFEWENRRRL